MSRSNAGVGFAIPINQAKRVIDDLVNGGVVLRGYLGVAIQDLDENKAKVLGIDSQNGAFVSMVVKNGPASNAGILEKDVIIEKGAVIGDGVKIGNNSFIGSNSVIGTEKSIKNIQAKNIRKYHKEHYVLSNMSLVLIGNYPNKIHDDIKKYFNFESKPYPFKQIDFTYKKKRKMNLLILL